MTELNTGMDQDTVTRLVGYIEKIERMEQEKKEIGELIKDEFSVAKSAGFDPKIMKQCIKLRSRDDDDIQEEEALLDTYRRALGMT